MIAIDTERLTIATLRTIGLTQDLAAVPSHEWAQYEPPGRPPTRGQGMADWFSRGDEYGRLLEATGANMA